MKNKAQFRFALAKDRDELEALQWRASLANINDRESLLANPDAIELPVNQIESSHVIVAEIDNACVGFASVQPRPDSDTELDGLFVDPKLWRSGLGRELVERCCALAKQMGAMNLHVIGNPHAIGFYKLCGFVETGTFQTRFGPGITMCRKLT